MLLLLLPFLQPRGRRGQLYNKRHICHRILQQPKSLRTEVHVALSSHMDVLFLSLSSSRSCSPTSSSWRQPGHSVSHRRQDPAPTCMLHTFELFSQLYWTAVPGPHLAVQGHERDVGPRTSPVCLGRSCLVKDLRTPQTCLISELCE